MTLQEAFDAGFDAVKAYVDEALTAFESRLKAMEAHLAALPPPQGDKEIGRAALASMITLEVGKAVEALPRPKDGKSVTPDEIRAFVDASMAEAVAKLPKPLDAATITDNIKAEVAKTVAALPPPKDGESVTAEDLGPMLERFVAEAIAKLPKAKDGIGLAGGVIDKDGALHLTLTDGAIIKLGRVVGDPGKPGKDGFGFDDLEVAQDGDRGMRIRFLRGEECKEFPIRLRGFIDRGVYHPAETYVEGDALTWGGSLWIAQRETSDKPGTSDAWRLAVKRGDRGKDA